MSIISRRACALTSSSALALITASLPFAAQAAAGSEVVATVPNAEATGPQKTDAPEVQAIVVTASKGKAADVAPVSSSLKATEPQAIITRKFIEETAPRVGDYTTTAVLAPSMSTIPNPNGPGATDGAKLTLRGFQDGEFNVTYDGIAWGDTNGPSHHANSFFPSSTIGGVVIDRGPGQATDLGQANFGGSVNLFSLPFEDHPGFRQTLTAASYGTYQSVTTVESGPIAQAHDLNVVGNMMFYQTDGYLTNSPSKGANGFLKATLPITSKLKVTGLYTRNYDSYYQGDSNSAADVAQTTQFGKRFALSDDPRQETYKGYNFTKKETDFGYVRFNADLDHGLKLEDTTYTYWYSNKTLSGADDSSAGTTLTTVTLFPGDTPNVAYPAGGSGYAKGLAVAGLPGYLKRNEYRVIGNIFKGSQDFGFGTFTAGVEYEYAKTERSRFDIDLLTGRPDFRQKAATLPGPSGCPYTVAQVAPGKAYNGACEIPLNIEFSEYSGWNQYQPFAQFEWRPTDKLSITPGVKYVNFDLFVHAPALAVKGAIQPTYEDQTFTKTLPFLTINYRYRPNWSFYAQYAQGFLVPNVSSFYVNLPQDNKVVPQESTNYQLGSVFAAGKFTFDGDLYYIDFKHKIQTAPSFDVPGETVETNSGGATYKGIEFQGTYVLPYGFSAFGNYSNNMATANGDPLNPGGNGKQIAKAPRWTAALGLRSQRHNLFLLDDELVTTVTSKWIGQQFANAASGTAAPNGLIPSFNETDLTSTYKLGHYSIELQLLNIFNSEDITSLKGKALIAGTNLPATTLAQGGALNQFTYQTGRSFQITLKAAF